MYAIRSYYALPLQVLAHEREGKVAGQYRSQGKRFLQFVLHRIPALSGPDQSRRPDEENDEKGHEGEKPGECERFDVWEQCEQGIGAVFDEFV